MASEVTYVTNSRVKHEADLPGSKPHALSSSHSSFPTREKSRGLSVIANRAWVEFEIGQSEEQKEKKKKRRRRRINKNKEILENI